MNKKISPSRRLIVTIIGFVLITSGVYLSQTFLLLFDERINSETQPWIFAAIIGLIGIAMLTALSAPLSRFARELLNDTTPLISKNAMVALGLMFLFGFGMGIVILTFTGFIIYTVFGG